MANFAGGMNNIMDAYYRSTYEKYQRELNELLGRREQEHCEEYEELTMEEKMLVDVDMEHLKDEWDMRYITSLSRKNLERCLSKLRKRDRKNGKRNGK